MFEKYTDNARLVIFFARYEVSQLGSDYIEPEHLLLGLLRKDKALLADFLPPDVSTKMIRQQVEASITKREKIPTVVEIPLSQMSKRVLEYARAESENLKHREVGTEHLLLGLLRHEKSLAERVLRENGLEVEKVRERIKSKGRASAARTDGTG